MHRKPSTPNISMDQAIKELLQMHPDDTLEFLLPEVVRDRGRPIAWQFHNVQVRKKDLTRKGFVMDLNIEYSFANGSNLLLILAEHWSTGRSIDLIRTGQYFLDLKGRFPEHEIVPVALITEIEDHPVKDELVAHGLGEEVLRFRTRIVQLSRTQAESWADVRNLVAQTLLMAMGGTLSRNDRLQRVIRYFQGYDDQATQLLFPLLTQVGKFNDEENNMTYKYLRQLPKPKFMEMLEADIKATVLAEGIGQGIQQGIERGIQQGIEQGIERGIEQGIEKGIRATKLEDARKMLARGCDWEFITDITGIVPKDLKQD